MKLAVLILVVVFMAQTIFCEDGETNNRHNVISRQSSGLGSILSLVSSLLNTVLGLVSSLLGGLGGSSGLLGR
ncbi:hypothetical protein CHUAL_008267 [Chamberlinius hualienensis]